MSGYMMFVAMDSKKTEELVRALHAKSDQVALHLSSKGVKVAL
jgi:galactokinase/mevalonate kinase-like predicted kinase